MFYISSYTDRVSFDIKKNSSGTEILACQSQSVLSQSSLYKEIISSTGQLILIERRMFYNMLVLKCISCLGNVLLRCSVLHSE